MLQQLFLNIFKHKPNIYDTFEFGSELEESTNDEVYNKEKILPKRSTMNESLRFFDPCKFCGTRGEDTFWVRLHDLNVHP